MEGAPSPCAAFAADDIFRYKKIIGYVPQDDTMMRECTVRENILFSARMRLPREGWPDARICAYVDAVIEVLGLSECSNTLIGAMRHRVCHCRRCPPPSCVFPPCRRP